jgi:hypothetical protein
LLRGAPIDNWLRKSITEQIKADRLRVWCATDREARLVGFYGLTAHEVRPAPALARRRETKSIPAIYLPLSPSIGRARAAGSAGRSWATPSRPRSRRRS